MRRARLSGLAGITIALLAAAPAAQSTTIVSGDRDTNAPFVIDPSSDPPGPVETEQIDLAGAGPRPVALIRRMPVTKTIQRVTLGDLSSDPSCTVPAAAKLLIREHTAGDPGTFTQVAMSASAENLPTARAQVTWSVPQTKVMKGRGYSFALSRLISGCRFARWTTWPHNTTTVEGGSQRCTGGPPAKTNTGDPIQRRMWHAAGANDRDPACVTSTSSFAFDPSMPEGWLMTSLSSPRVVGGSNWTSPPSNTQVCGAEAAAAGARVVWWRFSPTNALYSDYVCRWSQYEPLDQTTAEGWYYGVPWNRDGTGAPRDTYLKLETIDYQDLLDQHVPELRYDDDELFYPMSVRSITDFYVDNGMLEDSNALKGPEEDPEQIAVANPGLVAPLGPLPADPLALVYLAPRYPSGASARAGTDASASDFLSERGAHSDIAADDARSLQADPWGRYFGRIYGHVAADSEGRTWLQYFRFYYYNEQDAFGVGSHEGDWESIQLRLDHSLQPDLVSFEAHNGEETCNWADVVTSYGRVVAWIGAGSHAAYSRPGQYRLGLDNAQGDGLWLLAPTVEAVSSDTPWMAWPGRWGDSGGNSPPSPLNQGAKWEDPEAWTGNVDNCDMGDPF